MASKKNSYSFAETKIFQRLDTPAKIQDFLNGIKFNFESQGDTCQSPRRVLKSRKAHCMEGAMLAAAILEFHGYKPLVMDLKAAKHDFDHVVALFRAGECWGALSKTNHSVLRYREPIYKTLRELAMSYFHEYFDDRGRKNLRGYSIPFNLKRFDNIGWRTSEEDLFEIPEALDEARHLPLLGFGQIRSLRQADRIEIIAGKIVEFKKPR